MMSKKIYVLVCMAVVAAGFFSVTYSENIYYNKEELLDNSSTCLDCHENMEKSLAESPHSVYSESELTSTLVTGCIGCHDNWEEHIEDPSADNIGNPSKITNSEQSEVCGRCHTGPHQAAMMTSDPHGRAQIGCLSCHKIHDNHNKALVTDDSDSYCVTCHTSVRTEFSRRSAHPLESGNIRCTDCHNLAVINDPMLQIGSDWQCQECHAENSGPFLYEHKIVYNHLVEGGSCLECHQPHGSPNDRLLNQPDNAVCKQCHITPVGHMTQHSGLGTKLACVECHSQIHGSNDNNLFLDPNLGAKLFPNCNQSGCHGYGN
jgi:DmsE family decaheme c-type cytochrome